MKNIILTFAACFCFVSVGFTQADKRVQQQLDRLKIKYDKLSSGNFRVNYRFSNTGRKQSVVIESKTDKFGKLEVREVYGVIWESKVPVPDKMLNELLIYNSIVKMGTWALEKTRDGKDILYFAVKMDANANLELFKDTLTIVHKVADRWEKKLFNKDDF